jgi:hypothetical protein
MLHNPFMYKHFKFLSLKYNQYLSFPQNERPSYTPIQYTNVAGMSYTVECEQKQWNDLKGLP